MRTKRDLEINAWGQTITLPKGTRIRVIGGANGGYAVDDAALLVRLTGNTHDPKHRYLWVDEKEVV